MNIIGRIFGSTKVIEGLSESADKVFFTKEEKAINWIKTLKAYEPFKIAQRFIAIMVTSVYLFGWVTSVGFFVISYWYKDAINIATQLAQYNNDTLSVKVLAILSFYFAGGAAEGIVNRVKKK